MVTIFAVCAVVGVLLLISSLVLGDHFGDVHGIDGGLPWLSAPALAAAVGVFGVVGWPLSNSSVAETAVVVLIAAAAGVCAYGLLVAILRAIRRSQSGTVAGLAASVGTIGEVSMAVPAGGWGQVTYLDGESVRATSRAVLVDGALAAERGVQALIVDVDGDHLVIQPLDTSTGFEQTNKGEK